MTRTEDRAIARAEGTEPPYVKPRPASIDWVLSNGCPAAMTRNALLQYDHAIAHGVSHDRAINQLYRTQNDAEHVFISAKTFLQIDRTGKPANQDFDIAHVLMTAMLVTLRKAM